MAPQFSEFKRVRRRIRRTLCYGTKQTECINLPLSELVVDYFNKRSPFDYMKLETSANISGRGYADPCTLVVAMVYLDRLRVKDKEWFESSDPSDLYLPALVLASKFLHDSDTCDRASNAEWAEAANISTQHLNRLEWNFVQRLNWNVMVDGTDFEHWLRFFECWVANDFLAKNGFCTYNEMAQLSIALPLAPIFHALVSCFSVMTMLYTFSVFSLFAIPCTLSQVGTGVVENATERSTPFLLHGSVEDEEIMFSGNKGACVETNYFSVSRPELTICDSTSMICEFISNRFAEKAEYPDKSLTSELNHHLIENFSHIDHSAYLLSNRVS